MERAGIVRKCGPPPRWLGGYWWWFKGTLTRKFYGKIGFSGASMTDILAALCIVGIVLALYLILEGLTR
jgi:hypothetical protein